MEFSINILLKPPLRTYQNVANAIEYRARAHQAGIATSQRLVAMVGSTIKSIMCNGEAFPNFGRKKNKYCHKTGYGIICDISRPPIKTFIS